MIMIRHLSFLIRNTFFAIAILLCSNVHCLFAEAPIATYLTWQNDPTTTMTILWITTKDDESNDVYFKESEKSDWQITLGSYAPMPLNNPYLIHRAELKHLQPGMSYHFKVGKWNAPTRKFRTISLAPDAPIRFVVGGDMYHDDLKFLIETHQQAAKMEPHFALTGGDLAYTGQRSSKKPHPKACKSWLEWLKAWDEHMITSGGYSIPVIPCIGNHDVNGRFGQTPNESPYFYAFFPFPGDQGYNVIDFGNYLSLVILDSGHTHSIYGDQTLWLYQLLEERKNIPHKFALYHVAAYPSVRKFSKTHSRQIRQHWVPIFETFGLNAAFEHHDHAYKRTHPIARNKVHPNGVVYLGDGAWGVEYPRKTKSLEKTWYLANAKSKRHFIMVTLAGNQRFFNAIDSNGHVIDSYAQLSR